MVIFLCLNRNWGRGVVFLGFLNQKNSLSGSSQLHLNWFCNTLQWDLDYRVDAWFGKTHLEFWIAGDACHYSSYRNSAWLVNWPVLTWSHWKRINAKPYDATSPVTAEGYLTSLPVSSAYRQAACGLAITNLKTKLLKALLVAVRLQLLSFIWKLVFNVLAFVYVRACPISWAWTGVTGDEASGKERKSCKYCGWKANCLTVMPFLWECSATRPVRGLWSRAAHPEDLLSHLSDLSHDMYGTTLPPLFQCCRLFAYCLLDALTRSLRTVKFYIQELWSTFVIVQKHWQRFINPFVCSFMICSREG